MARRDRRSAARCSRSLPPRSSPGRADSRCCGQRRGPPRGRINRAQPRPAASPSSASSMIRRAASRTNSERPSADSPSPDPEARFPTNATKASPIVLLASMVLISSSVAVSAMFRDKICEAERCLIDSGQCHCRMGRRGRSAS
jgi:hypothetical protein